MNDIDRIKATGVVLAGAGMMSATLGILRTELYAGKTRRND